MNHFFHRLKQFVKDRPKLFAAVFALRNLPEEIRSFLLPIFPPARPADFRETAFHGDSVWQEMTKKIAHFFSATSITETGTYKGNTTHFFAANFSVPVRSCEFIGMYRRESAFRLRTYPHAQVVGGSSPVLLSRFAGEGAFGAAPLFFLDAHWYTYWPLLDELEVLRHLPKAVIMIDDFKVPGRNDFGYDSQPTRTGAIESDLRYIAPKLRGNNIHILFPNYGASQAFPAGRGHGLMRGYVIIFQNLEKKFEEFKRNHFVVAHYTEAFLPKS